MAIGLGGDPDVLVGRRDGELADPLQRVGVAHGLAVRPDVIEALAGALAPDAGIVVVDIDEARPPGDGDIFQIAIQRHRASPAPGVVLANDLKAPKAKAQPDPPPKVPALNYRHHFHAGNFADVMKHALWLRLLERLTTEPAPLDVIDTHAGAGLYDLEDAMARRSKEAEAGIGRLMADPEAPLAFAPLKAAVAAENRSGALRFYPGSPVLTVGALRPGDRFLGCELRADDQAALQGLLDRRRGRTGPDVRVVLADGYAQLGEKADARQRRKVHLIDPPFERGDEYAQIVAGVARALAADAGAVFAIWTPLKDLETFDALLRGLEALEPPSLLVAETRLRPLLDPMKMNGSAMLFIGGSDLEAAARAVCDWTAAACGDEGAKARVWKLGL